MAERTAANIRPRALPIGHVTRPELHARFGLASGARVTLVSAPAGSGKTTLVREWIDGLPAGSWAWLSVGAAEIAPSQFWLSVIDGLQTVEEAVGVAAREFLRPRNADVARAIDSLVDDLAWVERPTPIVLVVDDVHRIAPEIVDQLDRFIDGLVETTHLVVSTRVDHGLRVARRRATGELVEIRADDLTFSDADAAQLFSHLGLDGPEHDHRRLNDRTEGWIAGLSLAATSMRRSDDPSAFLRSFGGWERSIAEFLVDEVLDAFDPATRDFLITTCMLDEVSPALGDAMTRRSDGLTILRDLAANQTFVDRIDGEEEWYRYHHLLAEALRVELNARGPAAIRRLHLRASEWFASAGLPAEAIDHARRIDDRRRVMQLLVDHHVALFNSGRTDLVQTALAGADIDSDAGDPARALDHAEALAFAADPVPTLDLLERIERRLHDDDRDDIDDTLRARFHSLRALSAAFAGDVERAIGEVAAVEALAGRLPTSEIGLRTRLNLGRGLRVAGRSDDARRVLRSLHPASRSPIGIAALGALAEVDLEVGEIDAACSGAEAAIAAWTASGAPLTVAMSDAFRVRGWCRYESGDAPGAIDALEEALRMASHTRHGIPRLSTLVALARIESRLSIHGRAAARLEDARTWWPDFPIGPEFMARFHEAATDVALSVGDLDGAEASHRDLLAIDRPLAQQRATVVAARLGLAAGRHELALDLLRAAATDNVSRQVECSMLSALAHHRRGDGGSARAAVATAVGIGLPTGFRATLAASPELLDHLRGIHRSSPSPALAEVLVLGSAGVGPGAPLWIPEPLTNRELDVLRLLPTHLTNRAMAAELFVSLNTVKGHVKSVYRKLRASTRSEAVVRAREHGLLP